MPRNPEYERWPLARFKSHPDQAKLKRDRSDAKLAELAADLKVNGLRVPVEAKADGTLIAGYQRLRAARLLGWTELDVKVRYDLEGASPDRVVAALIQDNLHGPDLSPLDRARAYLRLAQIERGESSRGRPSQRVLDAVASKLHLSPRNLARYLRVMEADPEVQAAFDRGEITLTDAGKTVNSPQRDRIRWRLKKGEPGKQVLAEELNRPRPGGGYPRSDFIRRARVLRREVEAIAQTEGAIDLDLLQTFLPVFQKCSKLLARLIRQAQGRSA